MLDRTQFADALMADAIARHANEELEGGEGDSVVLKRPGFPNSGDL